MEASTTELTAPASIAVAVAVFTFLGAMSVAALVLGVRLAKGHLKIRSELVLRLMRLHRQMIWRPPSSAVEVSDEAMVQTMGMWLASGGLMGLVTIVLAILVMVLSRGGPGQ